MTDSRINIRYDFDYTSLTEGTARASQELGRLGPEARRQAAEMEQSFTSSFRRVGMAIGGAFALGTVREFMSEVVRTRSEIQSLSISFETLTGSAEKGTRLMSQLKQFAVSTPMQLGDLAKGAQTLLGFNVELEKVMPLLRTIGDISMGDAQKFGSLTLAFSQMSATGKLMGQDLLQMINAGFNPLTEIAARTGKSISQLKDEMSEGKITVEMVEEAFMSAASEGGKFHNMLASQGKAMKGSMAQLQGAVADMYNEIGEASEGAVGVAVSGAQTLVEHYKEVGVVVGTLIAEYGLYKAALMVTAATEEAHYASELKGLSALLPAKEADRNADISAAVAKGQLTESRARELVAVRAEVAALQESINKKLEAVIADRTLAGQAVATAEAEVAAATTRLSIAEAHVEMWNREMMAAQEAGLAEQERRAVQQLGNAVEEQQIATRQKKNAVTQLDAANTRLAALAEQEKALATQRDTIAEGLNTVAKQQNTRATLSLAGAKATLAKAARATGLSMLANPYVLMGAAVAGLTYVIYRLATSMTEAEKAQQRLHKAMTKATSESQNEISRIRILISTLRNAEKNTTAYKNAKETILNQYGKYLSGLVNERNEIIDLEAAYLRLAQAARDSANARALADATKEADDDYTKSEEKHLGKIYDFVRGKVKGTESQNTLIALIKQDMEANGRITSVTENILGEAFGEKRSKRGKWNDASTIAKILREQGELSKSKGVHDESIRQASQVFGKLQNPYASWDRLKRDRAITDLQSQIDMGEKNGLSIILDGREVQRFKTRAEALLAINQLKEANATPPVQEGAGPQQKEEVNDPKGTDKSANEAKRKAELAQKLADEAADMQRRNLAAEVELMEEGEAKKLAVLRRGYEDRKAELDRQERDWKKENTEAGLGASLTPDQSRALADARALNERDHSAEEKKILGESAKERADALQRYLEEYGTFEERRLAITRRYEREIAEARKKGLEGEAMRLGRERDGKVQEMEFRAVQADIDWANVFSGMGGAVSGYLRPTLEKLDRLMSSPQFASLPATEKKQYYDARASLDAQVNPGPTNPFAVDWGEMGRLTDEYREAILRATAANQNAADAAENLRAAEANLAEAEKGGDKLKILRARQDVADAKSAKGQADSDKETADQDASDAGNALNRAKENTSKAINGFADSLSRLRSESLAEVFDGVVGVIDGFAGKTDKAGNAVSVLGDKAGGMVGAILTVVDIMSNDPAQFFSDLVDKVFDAVCNMVSMATDLSMVQDMVGGMLEGIGSSFLSMADSATFGLFNLVGDGGRERFEDAMEQLTTAGADLATAIKAIAEEIKDASPAEAREQYERQLAMLQAQEGYNREAMNAALALHEEGHSGRYYIDQELKKNGVLAQELAKYGHAGSYHEMTADDWADLARNRPDILSWLKTLALKGNDGKDSDISQYIDNFLQYSEQYRELRDSLNQAVTQTSFDSLRSGFLGVLRDMRADTQSFADSFEELMKEAMYNSLLNDSYKERIQQWYDSFAEAMGDSDGLTSTEQRRLREEYMRLSRDIAEERDRLNETMGWEESVTQGSTTRSIAQMSQDTGDAIAGRLTAIQMSVEAARQSWGVLLSDNSGLKEQLAEQNRLAAEARALHSEAVTHLETIARNTAPLREMKEQLEKIERNTRAL